MKYIGSLAVGLTLILSNASHASVMKPVEFSELVSRSSWIVHGRVVKRESFWDTSKSRIYTRVTMEVTTLHKGDRRKDDSISFVTLGGQVGRYAQRVIGEPNFEKNEEVLLFLERRGRHAMVAGMAQGKFRIERKASRVYAVRNTSCVKWHGSPPRTRYFLEELEQKIRDEKDRTKSRNP